MPHWALILHLVSNAHSENNNVWSSIERHILSKKASLRGLGCLPNWAWKGFKSFRDPSEKPFKTLCKLAENPSQSHCKPFETMHLRFFSFANATSTTVRATQVPNHETCLTLLTLLPCSRVNKAEYTILEWDEYSSNLVCVLCVADLSLSHEQTLTA